MAEISVAGLASGPDGHLQAEWRHDFHSDGAWGVSKGHSPCRLAPSISHEPLQLTCLAFQRGTIQLTSIELD